MIRPLLAVALALSLVPAARAQNCSGGQTLFKNDVLPAIPGTQTVAVIAGLCEGEAAGCVFNVGAPGSTVNVKSAAIGYIDGFSIQGFTAAVNLIIYDGITFSPGGIPTLGTEVFDFSSVTGGLIQLTSSGINVMDLSQFTIPISSGKLVVTWWMDTNLGNGNCQQGYTTNFATDYGTGLANCNVTQKNLIYILGLGWRDAATAAIGPVQLCPNYYAGNWLIRSCVEPAGNVLPFCYGDGSLATPCPCNNFGAIGHGCDNSQGTSGALLTSTGGTVPDTIVFTSAGELPSSISIFLQGNTQNTAGLVFGDGVRCVTGALKRLYTKNASGGVVTAPTGAEPSVTTRSATLGDPILPGTQRYYQVYYRDGNSLFCPLPTGNSFNASGGLKITW